jgi:hypothetical protein
MAGDPRAKSATEQPREAFESSIFALEAAKKDVEAAEMQLETVLAEIRVAPRAEKRAVSQAIESALERLRAARAKVVAAEATLANEKKKP